MIVRTDHKYTQNSGDSTGHTLRQSCNTELTYK